MSDSTSQEGDAEGDGMTCLACGESIADDDPRRVVPSVEDGQTVLRRFCDEACLNEWHD